MNSQDCAKIALEMISKVAVTASDENLEAVFKTRLMLRQIAAGSLVVVEPTTDKAVSDGSASG